MYFPRLSRFLLSRSRELAHTQRNTRFQIIIMSSVGLVYTLASFTLCALWGWCLPFPFPSSLFKLPWKVSGNRIRQMSQVAPSRRENAPTPYSVDRVGTRLGSSSYRRQTFTSFWFIRFELFIFQITMITMVHLSARERKLGNTKLITSYPLSLADVHSFFSRDDKLMRLTIVRILIVERFLEGPNVKFISRNISQSFSVIRDVRASAFHQDPILFI